MRRLQSVALGLLLLLLAGPAVGQSDKEARKAKREYEKKVSKAISEFKKTYSKQDFEIAEGMKKLAEYKHPKVVKEIARWVMADWKIVAKTAVELLSKMRHPDSAKALAAAWKKWIADKEMVSILLDATTKFQFDQVTIASYQLFDMIFDQNVGSLVYSQLGHLKKIRSVTSVEPLIGLLKKIEETIANNAQSGGQNDGNEQFKKELNGTLTVLTGQKYTTHSDWDSWWKRSRTAFYGKVVVVHWCEKSWELWEKTQKQKKKCPHHQDEKKKSRAKEVPCMYKPL